MQSWRCLNRASCPAWSGLGSLAPRGRRDIIVERGSGVLPRVVGARSSVRGARRIVWRGSVQRRGHINQHAARESGLAWSNARSRNKTNAERTLNKHIADANAKREARQAKKDQKGREKARVKEEKKQRKRDQKKQRAETPFEHVTKSGNYFEVPRGFIESFGRDA